MEQFLLYLDLGFEHILDPQGYDHILFVVALCALYVVKDWKKVLILVTAFTIGHSITLGLATFKVVDVNTDLVEFLIPVSILITALINIFTGMDRNKVSKVHANYAIAAFFGLIHGLGFSNYLRAILGGEDSIVMPLLAFNIGIEVGQIIIVLIFMLFSFILVDLFGVNRRDWKLIISSAIAGIATTMILESGFL